MTLASHRRARPESRVHRSRPQRSLAGRCGAAAHTRLRLAIEVASTSRCALGEAEATRELALVLAGLGKEPDAFTLMGRAAAELERLKPAGAQAAAVVGTFSAGVRAWGELLAVLHPAAAPRAQRIAASAVARARDLGCDEATQVLATLRRLRDEATVGTGPSLQRRWRPHDHSVPHRPRLHLL